ncbi:unnamed protein product [Rotaria magnacalcarata]|uniref:Uncharacterized protein n=1 Tax=Rotaria magnacalcarata TaxID=392030 RepID=A0A814ZZV2_9BILA|nr:unnamed protein product [Rotaria magnacalcarata]
MDHRINREELHEDVICVQLTNIAVKFLKNPLFCSKLRQYLCSEYLVDCRIPSEFPIDDDIGMALEFSGAKVAVQLAHDHVKALFQMVKTKIYNNENTDKNMIYWSNNIYSDSAIDIIQRIFDNHNVFTIWEKTDVLSGYYVVHYFSPDQPFHVSERSIDQIIYNEIVYVKDMVVSNLDSMQTNFRNELDQFINQRKQEQQNLQTLAIIYCEYPLQTELKFSFFGQKCLVNNARKQLQYLLNKHEMKTINIELDSTQREYLLENCIPQLNTIELEHRNDNVKIQIRENVYYAPQYLTSKVKKMINELIFYTATISFQCIENACTVTTSEQLDLEQITRKHNCQMDRINLQSRNELIHLPKARTISTIKSTSPSIIQESNQFITKLMTLNRIVTSSDGIEIHKTQHSIEKNVDITIISEITAASEEQIAPDRDNVHSETNTRSNILFVPWVPTAVEFDSIQSDDILENSITEFISTCLTQIASLPTNDVKRIAFSTEAWGNYSNKKQLAEKIISTLRFQLETEKFSNRHWTFLFFFNEKQSDMFDFFTQAIASMQHETNDYKKFYCPISMITITLKTSRNVNINKCQNAINDYFRKHIVTKMEVNDAFNSEIWNQHMINVFYKYCVEKSVFPKIDSIDEKNGGQRLELLGSASAVSEMKQRYKLLEEIIKQKASLSICTHEQIETTKSHQLKLDISSNEYNILILSSSKDEVISNRLGARLIDEGYLVYVSNCDESSSTIMLQLAKIDLILIYFSHNYLEDENCMAHIKLAKTSEKKIIPILSTQSLVEQTKSWLDSVTTVDLYYELFREEIHFKLDEDFGFDYDKLLVELLHYTKSGIVGQTYSVPTIDSKKDQQSEEISNQQNLEPQVTPEQRRQREEIYEETIKTMRNRNAIPADEVASLIESLTLIIESCKNDELLDGEGENREEEPSYEANNFKEKKLFFGTNAINDNGKKAIGIFEHNRNKHSSDSYPHSYEIVAHEQKAKTRRNLNDLCLCIKRWMQKASNGVVIKGNMPPFTLTGDFNDAPYPILLLNKPSWWSTSKEYLDFDHSPPNIYFHYPQTFIGSWFSQNEAHDCYQTSIDRDILVRNERQLQRYRREKLPVENEHIQAIKSSHKSSTEISNVAYVSKFTTEFKEGHIAWDITEDVLIVKEYEKRRTKTTRKKNKKNLTAWERLLEGSVELLSDIKDGKIDSNSDVLQGKIGNELRTEEDMQKLHALDNPNNKRWTIKRPRRCTLAFLQAKIQNTIEFNRLCESSGYM